MLHRQRKLGKPKSLPPPPPLPNMPGYSRFRLRDVPATTKWGVIIGGAPKRQRYTRYGDGRAPLLAVGLSHGSVWGGKMVMVVLYVGKGGDHNITSRVFFRDAGLFPNCHRHKTQDIRLSRSLE